MDKWRLFGVGAIVACCVAVLGACSPEPPAPVITDLGPTPSESATAVPSATPSASAGVLTRAELLELLPENAGEPGLEGAMLTAKYFLTLYAPMFQSGDTAVWDALSGPECGYCAESSANAQLVMERGWTATGGEITPDPGVPEASMGTDQRAYVYVPAHLNDAILTKDSGTPEISEVASDQVFVVQLEFGDGLWLVQGVKFGDE